MGVFFLFSSSIHSLPFRVSHPQDVYHNKRWILNDGGDLRAALTHYRELRAAKQSPLFTEETLAAAPAPPPAAASAPVAAPSQPADAPAPPPSALPLPSEGVHA